MLRATLVVVDVRQKEQHPRLTQLPIVARLTKIWSTGFIGVLEAIGFREGTHRGNIRTIVGLYGDNGKENGN